MKKYYCECGWSCYKVTSANSFIEVVIPSLCAIENTFKICIERSGYENVVNHILKNGTEITKEKFIEVMNKALNHINHAAMMEMEPDTTSIFDLIDLFDEEKSIYDLQVEKYGKTYTDASHQIFSRNESIDNSLNSLT